MPSGCAVPDCKSNYKNGPQKKVYIFPKDPVIRNKWILAIKRANFTPAPCSRVCELHFKDEDFITTASCVHHKTGELFEIGLKHRRLRPDAIPSIFSNPTGSSSKDTSSRESPNSEKTITDQNVIAQDVEHKGGDTDSGSESENVDEPSIVIKQELVEPTDEPPLPIIDNIFSVEESVPSSNSASLFSTHSLPPSSSSSPFLENALPVDKPDSTNVNETPVTNKPGRKRKINNVKPDVSDSNPSATRVKLPRLAKLPMPSRRSRKPHLPSGTKKSAGRSIPRTESIQNATREMFQSLISSSKNNPLLGSRTHERSGDLFDVFADFIAEKLREMNWDNCAFALRAILDIVFKAGQVQRSSEEDSDISNSGTSSSSSSDQE